MKFQDYRSNLKMEDIILNNVPYTIIYFISNFFTVFIIQRFMETFFLKRKYGFVLLCLSYFLFFLLTSAAYILFNIPIILVLLNWVLIFVISLNYESTTRDKVINTTRIITFMLFPELVIGAITGYFHFSFFADGNYSNSIGIITTKIVTYIEALLFRNYVSTKNAQNIGWNLWLSSILIPISTLIYEIMFVSSENANKLQVIVSVVILFVINITAFNLYDSLSRSYIQKSKITILEKENELYSKQCEIMQNSTRELQAFRHDMNNQFISLSQLLSAKKYTDVEAQLNKLSHQTKSNIIYSTSGNIIIDGLINYKLQNAINDNIKVKTEIAVPVHLNIETTDITTVLGNLLDNALTEILKIEKEKRLLALKIVFSQQRLIIRVSNPYRGNIMCKDGRILTSKGENNNHGYGLSNISKAVDKYNGYMDVNYSDSIFTVDIIMYII